MKEFVEAWSSKFQSEKYPLHFYFSKIEQLYHANSPDQAGELIIELLHWKDGKVRPDVNGELLVGNKSFSLLPTKPHTYHSTKHQDTLCSSEFFEWVRIVRTIKTFEASRLKDIHTIFKLYGKETIVIPSFILHVISPTIYPLYDQHVDRAKRALLAQSIQKCNLDFQAYEEYQCFFQKLVSSSYGEKPTLSSIKKVDSALWSFGKWLKDEQLNLKAPVEKKAHIQKDKYTPTTEFKRDVLDRIQMGLSQLEAMKAAAAECGVTLAQSYYAYPGSHIYRWRKQLNED